MWRIARGDTFPWRCLTCAECYYVIGGQGSVQTLSHRGFAETPLREGTVAWFMPGTIHRLVNDDNLRIIVGMQNSGLPEADDAVFTFPTGILVDPQEYAARAQAGDSSMVITVRCRTSTAPRCG